jgi:hypothetical protein
MKYFGRAGHVISAGEMRDVFTDILVGRLEGKRPFGRPGHRWKVILKWALTGQECLL